MMLTGPIDVTRKVLKRAGMTLDDIDLIEVNEAFASVVLRYLQAFELDPAKVNVNGGAIAMGHPLGATGAMILGTLVDELERRDLTTGAGDPVHRRRHGHRDDHRSGVVSTAECRMIDMRAGNVRAACRHPRRTRELLCPRSTSQFQSTDETLSGAVRDGHAGSASGSAMPPASRNSASISPG